MATDDHLTADNTSDGKLSWQTPTVTALDAPDIAGGLVDIIEVIVVTAGPVPS